MNFTQLPTMPEAARATIQSIEPIIKPGGSLRYMPQLDGLRAIAVAMVVVEHYEILSFGTALHGVRLFFVLSGFLITAILLGSRDAVLNGIVPGRGYAMRQFLIRRTLRIFPLYYLVVFSSLLLGVAEAWEFAPWMLTYTLNWKIAEQGWYMGHYAHLWTLAVEEQFYLVWPWVILFTPRKWLLPATVAMILVGPLYRLYHVTAWLYFDSEASGLVTYVSTFSALDSLGIGALLAMLVTGANGITGTRWWWDFAAAISVAGLFLLKLLPARELGISLVVSGTLTAILFAWLILGAARGYRGPVGSFLSAKPMVYIGTISYGIYVYHLLVSSFTLSVSSWIGISPPASGLVLAGFWVIITLAISSLSAYAFERPINRLKSRFEAAPTVAPPLHVGESSVVPIVQPVDVNSGQHP